MPSKAELVGPGRFGPSRKKEAAARRAVSYKLWGLNATKVRAAQ
jgi:hypothetical protein